MSDSDLLDQIAELTRQVENLRPKASLYYLMQSQDNQSVSRPISTTTIGKSVDTADLFTSRSISSQTMTSNDSGESKIDLILKNAQLELEFVHLRNDLRRVLRLQSRNCDSPSPQFRGTRNSAKLSVSKSLTLVIPNTESESSILVRNLRFSLQEALSDRLTHHRSVPPERYGEAVLALTDQIDVENSLDSKTDSHVREKLINSLSSSGRILDILMESGLSDIDIDR